MLSSETHFSFHETFPFSLWYLPLSQLWQSLPLLPLSSPPDPCPTLLIYSSFILQHKDEGQCLPVVRNFSALSLISGLSCLVLFRYWSMKMFGANWTMFCSPQPKGMLSSWSKFWSAGPMMSPYIWEERREKGKAQTPSNVKQKDCCLP